MRYGAQLALGASLLRANPVNCAAMRDRRYPSDGAAPAWLEPGGTAPHLHENLLAYLLCLARISHHLADDAEDRRPGNGADCLERRLVPAGHGAHQVPEPAASRLRG